MSAVRNLAGILPDVEIAAISPLIAEIEALKVERNAVMLAHNYMTPEIFHGVADLSATRSPSPSKAAKTDADVIVMAGVHFMAETAKILSPDKTVLIPDLRAGCSLAESITGADVRAAHAALSRAAGRHLRQHLRRREGRDRHLLHLRQRRRRSSNRSASDQVIFLPDEYLGRYVARADRRRDDPLGGPLRGARALHGRRIARLSRETHPGVGHRTPGMPARRARRGRLRRLHGRHDRLRG